MSGQGDDEGVSDDCRVAGLDAAALGELVETLSDACDAAGYSTELTYSLLRAAALSVQTLTDTPSRGGRNVPCFDCHQTAPRMYSPCAACREILDGAQR